MVALHCIALQWHKRIYIFFLLHFALVTTTWLDLPSLSAYRSSINNYALAIYTRRPWSLRTCLRTNIKHNLPTYSHIHIFTTRAILDCLHTYLLDILHIRSVEARRHRATKFWSLFGLLVRHSLIWLPACHEKCLDCRNLANDLLTVANPQIPIAQTLKTVSLPVMLLLYIRLLLLNESHAVPLFDPLGGVTPHGMRTICLCVLVLVSITNKAN